MDFDILPYIQAGIPGILLIWSMIRMERMVNRLNRNVELMARAILRLLERRDQQAATQLSKGLHNSDDDQD